MTKLITYEHFLLLVTRIMAIAIITFTCRYLSLCADVVVHFETDFMTVMESQGNFILCIEVEGQLEKNITVAVNSTAEMTITGTSGSNSFNLRE